MTYDEDIAAWRENRERDLREGIMIGDMLWSPVPESERNNLKLHFFPINVNLKFNAKVTLLDSQKEITLLKEDGTPSEPFLQIGYVDFIYEKEDIRLSFVFDEQTNAYYIGFRDSTCGKESYPNGRLLQIDNIEQETTVLDFNKAFNFACAYNDSLYCPVTPPDNWLTFSIEAGEKKYK